MNIQESLQWMWTCEASPVPSRAVSQIIGMVIFLARAGGEERMAQ